jgi:phosphatidylglycerophosphatase A
MSSQTLFLTFFGTGLSPKAPGTVGSLAALFVGLAIVHYIGLQTLFLAALALAIVGIFEINRYEKETGKHDTKEIVIDEVVGMWIALHISLSAATTLHYPYVEYSAILLSFITFRLFDIWKPSTIGWVDREVKGGLGVMLDDIMAGLAGGVLTALLLVGLGKVLT